MANQDSPLGVLWNMSRAALKTARMGDRTGDLIDTPLSKNIEFKGGRGWDTPRFKIPVSAEDYIPGLGMKETVGVSARIGRITPAATFEKSISSDYLMGRSKIKRQYNPTDYKPGSIGAEMGQSYTREHSQPYVDWKSVEKSSKSYWMGRNSPLDVKVTYSGLGKSVLHTQHFKYRMGYITNRWAKNYRGVLLELLTREGSSGAYQKMTPKDYRKLKNPYRRRLHPTDWHSISVSEDEEKKKGIKKKWTPKVTERKMALHEFDIPEDINPPRNYPHHKKEAEMYWGPRGKFHKMFHQRKDDAARSVIREAFGDVKHLSKRLKRYIAVYGVGIGTWKRSTQITNLRIRHGAALEEAKEVSGIRYMRAQFFRSRPHIANYNTKRMMKGWRFEIGKTRDGLFRELSVTNTARNKYGYPYWHIFTENRGTTKMIGRPLLQVIAEQTRLKALSKLEYDLKHNL